MWTLYIDLFMSYVAEDHAFDVLCCRPQISMLKNHILCCKPYVDLLILYVADLHSSEHVESLRSIQNQIAQLYSTMNIEQYQLDREKELLERLEYLNNELKPLEDVSRMF